MNANSLSLAYPSENVLGYIPSYDLCTTPYFRHEVSNAEFEALVAKLEDHCKSVPYECAKGTQWQGVFGLIAGFMFWTSCGTGTLCLGSFFWAPRYIGSVCNCCCCIFSYTAMIIGFATRYNPIGNICAVNMAPTSFSDGKWDMEGSTYSSDAAVLSTFAILNVFVCCCSCFCFCFPCCATPLA